MPEAGGVSLKGEGGDRGQECPAKLRSVSSSSSLLMPRRAFVSPQALQRQYWVTFPPKHTAEEDPKPPPSSILQMLTRNTAENLEHLSKGCLIVFLFNTDVPHTPSGVRVPLQHLWVPKALRRELSGRNPAGMFPPHGTSSEFCSSSAPPLICVRASPAPAPWEFGNFVITNSLFSPPLGEV